MTRFKLLFVGLCLLTGLSFITDGSGSATATAVAASRHGHGYNSMDGVRHAGGHTRVRMSVSDQHQGMGGVSNEDRIRLVLRGRSEGVDLAFGTLLLLTMVPPPALLSLGGEPRVRRGLHNTVIAIRDEEPQQFPTDARDADQPKKAVGPRSN